MARLTCRVAKRLAGGAAAEVVWKALIPALPERVGLAVMFFRRSVGAGVLTDFGLATLPNRGGSALGLLIAFAFALLLPLPRTGRSFR